MRLRKVRSFPGWLWLACALALSCRPAPAQEPAETRLSGLEQALRADPDNLRLGNDYRQAAIRAEAWDRSIDFFSSLAEERPQASNVFFHLGLAYVDKIPTAGAVTQVILAERSLESLTASVEIDPRWANLYTRGNSYLFWPLVFGRVPSAVADLERVMAIQRRLPELRSHHALGYIALGDAYWRAEQPEKARRTWAEGLQHFPDNSGLARRAGADAAGLDELYDELFNPNNRVDTDLSILWREE